MQTTFAPDDLVELRLAASYIAGLPPIEEWVEIRQHLDPQIAVDTDIHWKCLGRQLDAFFGDYSDPLPDSGLSSSQQAFIQQQSHKYIIISALIFQGERFIRQEAQAIGRPYPFQRRSDLLKRWAYEDCLCRILFSLQKHYESPSAAQISERFRIHRKFWQDELKEEKYKQEIKRWDKEDANLPRDLPTLDKIMPWTLFCLKVFYKYRRELPAYDSFTDLLKPKNNPMKKFSVIEGQHKKYPGRGQGKK